MSASPVTPPLKPPSGVNPWQPHPVVISEIRPEVAGVATYYLAFREDPLPAEYRSAPGQFNMLYLPGAGEIAISVSDDTGSHGSWGHTVRAAGNVTRTLAGMKVGDTLGLRGPFGAGWPMTQCIGRDVILVAGGIGLPPLRPAISSLLRQRRQFGRLHLLYGARSPDTLLYSYEYADWTRQGLNVQITVDRFAVGWKGNVGVVTLLLERLNSFDPRNTVLFCCGPEVMMRFTASSALGRGLAPERIWISMERNMQCAVGLCGHCQLGPAFICRDGPVFRYDRIAQMLDVEGL